MSRSHKNHRGFWVAIAIGGISVDGYAHLWCAMDTEPQRPHLACRTRLEGYVWVDLVWRDLLPLCRRCLNVFKRWHGLKLYDTRLEAHGSYDPPIYPFFSESTDAYLSRLAKAYTNIGIQDPAAADLMQVKESHDPATD